MKLSSTKNLNLKSFPKKIQKEIEIKSNFELGQKLSKPYNINGEKAHPLNRFIPCDLKGNILEDPSLIHPIGKSQPSKDDKQITKQYQQAKDRVLFEGCRIYLNKVTEKFQLYSHIPDSTGLISIGKSHSKIITAFKSKTVEDLIIHDLIITESFKNHIGL